MPTFRRVIPPALAGLLMLPVAAQASGMPQLDFANPLTTSQVVWGAIIFVVLYILLSRLALPRVGEVLEQRAAHIARDLEGAKSAKEKADAGMMEAAAATAKARAEAQTAINAALEEAKAAAGAQAAVMNARLDRQLKDAEAQITLARTNAMGALRQVASETAGVIVTRLTGTVADPVRLDAAIGSALAARAVGQ